MTYMCIGCKKPPSEIGEYIDLAAAEGISPDQFVCTEEGTFNPKNGHFACTTCYIAMGMPASPRGWVAP